MKQNLKKRFGSLLAAMVAVWLLCTACVPCAMAADTQEPRVIRVGFFAYDGYHDTDANGARSGYGYELLQRMARYENVTYEYVGAELGWDEMLQLLREGKIDLLTAVTKTGQREREFSFSARDIGRESVVMTARAGDDRLSAGDYAGYDGINVAMVRGDAGNESFREFAREHGFAYTPVYYETAAGAHMALQNGTVMAAVGSSLRRTSGERVLETFSEKPVYAITRKDDSETMALVNDALSKMDRNEPGWRMELSQKYYTRTGEEALSFTREESEYLQTLQADGTQLTALVKPDRWPYSYINDQGEADGILVEAFRRIAQRVGLNVDIQPISDPDDYVRQVQAGEADFCIDLQDDWQAAENYGYKLTDPYVSANRSWVTYKLKPSTPETAVAVGAVTYVTDIRPKGVEFTFYKTNEACMAALRRGEADGFYTYSYYAEKVLYENLYSDLKSSLTGNVAHFRIGVNDRQNILLVSILNSGIASLSDDELNQITEEYTDLGQQPFSWMRLARQYPWLVFFFLCTVVLAVGAVLLAVKACRAQQEAERASRAKSDFLARMSHDIRTPINGIMGTIEIARTNTRDPDRMEWCLERMKGAADHLLSLINDVLDMAKIESDGVPEAEPEPIDLNALLEDCCAIAEGQMESRKLTFRRDFAALHHTDVMGSPLHLRQVLLNILSNAVKYTPDGGTIVFTAKETGCTAETVQLEFTVRDTGIGMSKEFLSHLFEPFSRAKEGRNVAQGTGLGMAITHRLVESMGGEITVQSTPGEGSTFTVRLALPRSEETAKRTVLPAAGKSLAGLHILLAEDNELNREVAQTLLEEVGAVVTTAENGRQAVELAKANDFDAVLMDIEMPEMNGLDAARAIRKLPDPARAGVPILAMTANVFEDAVRQCEQAGMNGHLGKPFDIRVVTDAILRCTGKESKQ